MALSVKTERAFRNSFALSYLLLGFALVAFSLGGALQFVLDITGGATWTTYADYLYTGGVLLIVLLYLAMGSLLIKNRPANWNTTPQSAGLAAPTLFRGGQFLAVILLVLGFLMLYNGGPYGRDTALAALLVLSGAFALLSTILFKRLDINIQATACIIAFLAAALLLAAQIRFTYQGDQPGTYGAWEITSLVVPRVFGPVALMIVALAGLVYAYARRPRPEFGSYFILSLAALVYGIGAALAGLAFFFNTPWSTFLQVGPGSAALLGALTAGSVLLTAGAICIIIASCIGLVRNGQGISSPTSKPVVIAPARPSRRPAGPTETTTTTAQRATPESTTTVHRTTTREHPPSG